jgi:hypothetical protein
MRDKVKYCHIETPYIPTNDNIADGLTKPLPVGKFEQFVSRLCLTYKPI